MADLENSAFVQEVHNFEPFPNSGVNTCILCEQPIHATVHPHIFNIGSSSKICTCGLPYRALVHQITRV
jgi:hypothetical protein